MVLRFTSFVMLCALAVAGTALATSVPVVSLDVSSAFNFDAVGTQTELDTARAWHDAGMGTGTDYSLQTVFGTSTGGEYYTGGDHWFMNKYNQRAYASDGTANTLGQTVTTPYGDYTLGAFQGSQDLASLSLGANAIRLGTLRGKSEPAADAGATVTINLVPSDQATYASINLLMSGTNNGDVVNRNGTLIPMKRAWTTVTAHYGDGTSEQVWTSPRSGTYAEYDLAGGIPMGVGFAEGSPGAFDPAYMASFNTVQVATQSIGLLGSGVAGSPKYSAINAGNAFMYDVAGGIAVDQTKVLTGLTVNVSNGPNQWQSGYIEGDTVNIYGISGIVIPEPATIGLLLLGGLGAMIRRRR
ncbi:MAG: PEP-CTERM sorting domain-containing protein [Planctomycetes bacterium]|nr:PEP-CTERM sorting domain-containing protein [Planctomycetota bacterium]